MERYPCCTIGDYLLLDHIQRSSGPVFSRAVHMSTQKMVKVKLLDHDCFTQKVPRLKKIDLGTGCFGRRISILKELDHDNVVKVLDGLLLQQSIPVAGGGHPFQLRSLLVMEFTYECDLNEWMKNVEDLGHSSQLNMFSQLVDGVSYLHSQNLFHGRIQPSNVWVQGGRPMLCGFGLGNSYDGQAKEYERWFYSAPECFEWHPYLPGKKSDVFSLGILLVQLHSDMYQFAAWQRFKMPHFLFCNKKDLRRGSPFIELPHPHCLTNFMKSLVYDMISPIYYLRIGVPKVKVMLDNEMDLM